MIPRSKQPAYDDRPIQDKPERTRDGDVHSYAPELKRGHPAPSHTTGMLADGSLSSVPAGWPDEASQREEQL